MTTRPSRARVLASVVSPGAPTPSSLVTRIVRGITVSPRGPAVLAGGLVGRGHVTARSAGHRALARLVQKTARLGRLRVGDPDLEERHRLERGHRHLAEGLVDHLALDPFALEQAPDDLGVLLLAHAHQRSPLLLGPAGPLGP